MKELMIAEFAPDQLLAEADDIVFGDIVGKSARRMPDTGRRNLSERQMRREQGGCRSVRKIAADRIIIDGAIDEVLQLLLRRGFARLPYVREF